MKTPEEIIQETINMIDEYEAKVDKISNREKRFSIALRWIVLFILLIIIVLAFLLL